MIKLIIDKKIEYDNAEVSIYDISGALLSKKNFASGDINLEANNLGKGVKIVIARIGSFIIWLSLLPPSVEVKKQSFGTTFAEYR